MSTRSTATKRRLFDAALDLIGAKGFSGTSVDEIVERAGVAKGTVYYHFASKAELVEALINDYLKPLSLAFRTAASEHAEDPAGAIDAIIRTELAFFMDRPAFAKVIITELWREDRVWRGTLAKLRSDLGNTVREIIAEGIRTGAFRGDVDPVFVGPAIFGMTATLALAWFAFEEEHSLDDFIDQAVSFGLHALRSS